ncbi:hypothetical protein [Pacificoceanicola onchidii]|uniref:hypothetical protein n=1 Tax=Pacificoceanicola onchidii TaxID=2562685 RepID=UPI0010A39E71|nr:hypothetical protein [Pacificoceanicola onchidii]
MAEDTIFSFKPSIKGSVDPIGDQIEADIREYMAFDHLEKSREAAQKADEPAPQWEDNVPPDFTDSFDFIL